MLKWWTSGPYLKWLANTEGNCLILVIFVLKLVLRRIIYKTIIYGVPPDFCCTWNTKIDDESATIKKNLLFDKVTFMKLGLPFNYGSHRHLYPIYISPGLNSSRKD